MVQLQADLPKLEAAGIQVVGISKDSTAVLKKFADASKVAFPLLSDPRGEMIENYLVLNPEAEGLPHPGTIVIDSQGVVRSKIFREGYKERHSLDELLTAAKSGS